MTEMDPLTELAQLADVNASRTKFHGGWFDVYRIHILMSHCNKYSEEGDLQKWKRSIDALHREVSPMIASVDKKSKKSEENTQEQIRDVTGRIVHVMKDLMVAKDRRLPVRNIALLNDQAYTLLYDYEMLIRKVTHKIGINLPRTGTRSALGGSD